MGTFKDLTNKKFNMLTVEKYLGNSKWLCHCECGNATIVRTALLNEDSNRRNKKSCGCLKEKNLPKNQDYFEEINTSEKAYILGFIASDGCVQPENNKIKIDLKEIDEDILLKIQKEIGHDNKLSHYKQKSYFNEKEYIINISRLVINSKQMIKDLQKYGVVKNKTDILNINLSLISKEFFFDFLRGMFDGDGCISFSKEKKYCDVTLTSTPIMLNKILDWLNKNCEYDCKFYLNYRHKDNLNNATIISTNKDFNKNFLKDLYLNSTIYLDRKFNKAKDFIKNY